MRVLGADGLITSQSEGPHKEWFRVAGDSDVLVALVDLENSRDLSSALNTGLKTVEVVFKSSADGRGFSMFDNLKQRVPNTVAIVASGLNPDQVTLALQLGFDGVVISDSDWGRYGAEAWQTAATPIVGWSYKTMSTTQVKSIWDVRTLNVS